METLFKLLVAFQQVIQLVVSLLDLSLELSNLDSFGLKSIGVICFQTFEIIIECFLKSSAKLLDDFVVFLILIQ